MQDHVVLAGHEAVAGASVEMYAAGTSEESAAAVPLFASPVHTNSSGAFNLPAFSCPAPGALVYVTATGGHLESNAGQANPQLAEMAVLGPCGDVSGSTKIQINEVTTIAAVAALAPFMKSDHAVRAGAEDRFSLAEAFATAAELADSSAGVTPGAEISAVKMVPSAKLATLANILSTCTRSTGGSAGDATACGLLFSRTLSDTGQAPEDTIAAMRNVAYNPTRQVEAIFDLNPLNGRFQPALTQAPADWAMSLEKIPAAPTFSPAPGRYSSPTMVTLGSPSSASTIYYTTDGSIPSTSSVRYSGAFPVSVTSTIKAIVLSAGVSSAVASASYSLPADQLVFATSPATGLAGKTLTPTPTIWIETAGGAIDASANGPVTVQVGANPGGGLLRGPSTVNAIHGVASFPGLWISTQGEGYTLMATQNGAAPVVSSRFNLTNVLAVALTSAPVAVGTSATATVLLACPAPSQGAVISVANSNPSVATLQATSISVPPGATRATFEYTGVAAGAATFTVSMPDSASASTLARIAPPVTMVVAPAQVTLSAAQSQAFSAKLSNASSSAVTWSLKPALGQISSGGVYLAPDNIPEAQTVTVTATSVAAPDVSLSAVVSLRASVGVTVSPGLVKLGASQKQVFTASVANAANNAVTWTVQPAIGSLSASGVYSAPAVILSPQSLLVTATSVADPTKVASVTVALLPDYFHFPGSSNSPFNTPLTSSEQLSPTPGGFAALLADLSSWFPPSQASSPAVWQASLRDPLVTVLFNLSSYDNINSGKWKRSGNSPAVEAQILASSSKTWQVPSATFGESARLYYMTTSVPANGWTPPLPPAINAVRSIPTGGMQAYVPSDALPAADSDGYFAIFQPDGSVLECYSGIVLSSGTVVCGTFNVTQADSDLTGSQGGVMASTVPVYAGLIRQTDLDAGVINHALNVCISASELSTSFKSPAVSFDRTPNYTGSLPMGSRLAIPLHVNLAAHHFNSPTGLMIAKAAQSYGMFLLDRGGPGSLTIRTEQNVTSAAVTKAWDWNTEQDLNWIMSQLMVVQ